MKLDAVQRNPVRGVERQAVTDSNMHRPYTHEQRAAVRAEIERRGDGQLLLFISFIRVVATNFFIMY